MLMPKFGSGGNVSDSIQSEGLTMLEGARVDVKINSVIHSIDTSKISFVLCGAFSSKAHDAAEKDSGSRIGFGAAPSPYSPTSGPWENRTSSTSASCRSSLAVSSGLSTWSP